MYCSAGETEHYEDPSLELYSALVSLEDIQKVGLKGCKVFFVQPDVARTGLFYASDHLADSWYEELGLYVGEDLEDVSTVS